MVIALDISINERDKEFKDTLKKKEGNTQDEILLTLRTLVHKPKEWKI